MKLKKFYMPLQEIILNDFSTRSGLRGCFKFSRERMLTLEGAPKLSCPKRPPKALEFAKASSSLLFSYWYESNLML